MSRIGKLPIKLPTTVEISHQSDATVQVINVKGKFGSLQRTLPEELKIEQIHNDNGSSLIVSFENQTRTNKSLQGLYRTLINNMVIGVTEQFVIILTLQGVGYRASVQGKSLVLNLGYSHPVEIDIPEGITVEVTQNTTLNIKACDTEQLGLFAPKVRACRPPEPYKGKGILYKNEQILRKAGKSGKK